MGSRLCLRVVCDHESTALSLEKRRFRHEATLLLRGSERRHISNEVDDRTRPRKDTSTLPMRTSTELIRPDGRSTSPLLVANPESNRS